MSHKLKSQERVHITTKSRPCSLKFYCHPEIGNLRRRPHDRQMPDHTGHLADKNFLIRIFLKTLTSTYFVSICVLSYVIWLIDWLQLALSHQFWHQIIANMKLYIGTQHKLHNLYLYLVPLQRYCRFFAPRSSLLARHPYCTVSTWNFGMILLEQICAPGSEEFRLNFM